MPHGHGELGRLLRRNRQAQQRRMALARRRLAPDLPCPRPRSRLTLPAPRSQHRGHPPSSSMDLHGRSLRRHRHRHLQRAPQPPPHRRSRRRRARTRSGRSGRPSAAHRQRSGCTRRSRVRSSFRRYDPGRRRLAFVDGAAVAGRDQGRLVERDGGALVAGPAASRFCMSVCRARPVVLAGSGRFSSRRRAEESERERVWEGRLGR